MTVHFQDDTIAIHRIQCGPYGNNAYIVVCPETNESIVIDAPPDPGALIQAAQQTNVKLILITHNHFDHIEGLEEVVSALGAPVAIGQDDADALATAPQIRIADGDEISAGNVTLTAIHTPGHTPGGCSFVTQTAAFVGDAIFAGSVGGPNISYEDEINSVRDNILSLPDDVRLFPGHGPPTTVGEEKLHNPFF